jgi:probable HAF family extracellular repeat protein
MRRFVGPGLLFLAIVVGVKPTWAESFFRGLGVLPGDDSFSWAYGVSGDGTVVVGGSGAVQGRQEAFRWTAAGGMVGLGALPLGTNGFYSRAYGVSGDGTVVVGESNSAQGHEAFRWTAAGGMVSLGTLPNDRTVRRSTAYGVSGDGTVVVGESDSARQHSGEPFRWTAAGGMVGVDLDALDRIEYGSAYGVSGDGTVVVGFGEIQQKLRSLSHPLQRWQCDL